LSDDQDGQQRPAPAVDPDEYRQRIGDSDGSTPQQRAMAASPPETAAVTHGGYVRGPLHCDACAIWDHCDRYEPGAICALDDEFSRERRKQLARALERSGHDLKLHGPLVERAVIAGVLIERMARYLAVHGDLEPEQLQKGIVKAQPGAEYLLKCIGAERSALEALQLTPDAMARMENERRESGASALVAAVWDAADRRIASDADDAPPAGTAGAEPGTGDSDGTAQAGAGAGLSTGNGDDNDAMEGETR